MIPGVNINKILEIDMDTERDCQVRVLQQATTQRQRNRQPDRTYDEKDNCIILANALVGQILHMEKKGLDKPGVAMSRICRMMENIYVDARCETNDQKNDIKGNPR